MVSCKDKEVVMKAQREFRHIYNEDGKRIKLPLALEAEWNEFMSKLRKKAERVS